MDDHYSKMVEFTAANDQGKILRMRDKMTEFIIAQ
jgi:hypothetical protein